MSEKRRQASGSDKRKEAKRKKMSEAAKSSKDIRSAFGVQQRNEPTSVATGEAEYSEVSESAKAGPYSDDDSDGSESSDEEDATVTTPDVHSVGGEQTEPEAGPSTVTNTTSSDSHEGINIFAKPASHDLYENYFSLHPVQPYDGLPYDPDVYNRKTVDGKIVNRKWLTFSRQQQKLFCCVCICFSSTKKSTFVRGCNDWRHVSQRVQEHEESKEHIKNSETHLMSGKESILHYMKERLPSKRLQEIQQNREVLDRVISVIRLIGKLCLPFRGHRGEAAYELDDLGMNHGVFLEVINLLRQYDMPLSKHLDKAIATSKERKKSGSSGRGALVTLISKTTVTKLLLIVKNLLQSTIADEIKKAGIFSVQIDSTQDITAVDQCAIVVRYVLAGKVNERLLAIVPSHSGTGQGLFDLVKHVFEEHGIDINKCVSNSTDGAAACHGQYSGFQSKLRDAVDTNVHVWCYAHVLNLVVMDSTKVCIPAVSLFNLLQKLAVFFKASYKRMDVWSTSMENKVGTEKLKKLKLIGETRWSGKSTALSTVFGTPKDFSRSVFIDMIKCLAILQYSKHHDAATRTDAKGILEGFLKYETILVAHIFMYIFQYVTPVSQYLQTSGLNLVQAWRQVQECTDQLQRLREDMKAVKERSDDFVRHMNSILSEIDWPELLNVTTCDEVLVAFELPEGRKRVRKLRPGETRSGEASAPSPIDAFRVDVYNGVLDQAVGSLRRRFSEHGALYGDIQCFDPKSFPAIKENGLPAQSLTKLGQLMPSLDIPKVKSELENFADVYEKLNQSIEDHYTALEDVDDLEVESGQRVQDGDSASCKTFKKCKSCLTCAFQLLENYMLHSEAYDNLYKVYHFLLTLSVTQVHCERCFSKLKLIKTRVRSLLTAEHLEALMLVSTETAMLTEISNSNIIDRFAQSSSALKRLLQY